MGMPPCRIGDLTAHGGTIMVGFPQVLIGEMPASRIGDMHVCPMVTPGVPPIPHVGGPFILGSPTVLVGMMPQSRVTDTLVCVGPPDVAALGCMTVLVGMAGGAGAAGAAAGAAAMSAPPPAAAAPGSADPTSTAAAGRPTTVASRQPDGSIQTASTVPGQGLPPMALKQPGWPDLPPENTATFQSVQPATVLPGTQLYAPGDGTGANSYWSTDPPGPDASDPAPAASDPGPAASGADPGPDTSAAGGDDSDTSAQDTSAQDTSAQDTSAQDTSAQEGSAYRDAASVQAAAALAQRAPGIVAATHVAVLTVTSATGLKAWAGAAAGAAQGMQVWAPPELAQAAATVKTFRLPGVQPHGGRP